MNGMGEKMKTHEIAKFLCGNLEAIINEVTGAFLKNQFYFETDVKTKREPCFRDLVNTSITNSFAQDTFPDKVSSIVWGKTGTEKYSEKEISFRKVLSTDDDDSYLNKKIGGVDLCILPRSCKRKLDALSDKEKGSYIFVSGKEYLDIFNSSLIGIELKVLHLKNVLEIDKGATITQNQSQYFLTGEFWESGDKKEKKYEFSPLQPSTYCEGALLSDIARGAFMLNRQESCKFFFTAGVIVGRSKDSLESVQGRNIEDRIYCLLGTIKESLTHGDTECQYVSNISSELDSIDVDVKVHEIQVECSSKKNSSDVFMFPYHIVLSKNDH